jgi:hypothetical protein
MHFALLPTLLTLLIAPAVHAVAAITPAAPPVDETIEFTPTTVTTDFPTVAVAGKFCDIDGDCLIAERNACYRRCKHCDWLLILSWICCELKCYDFL